MRLRSRDYPVMSSVDYVYVELRKMIMNKALEPGQRLIETVLAEQLNVSRTPVREALRRLANDGLVDLIPNGSARLALPSKKEVRGSFEVRSILECEAVKRAVNGITTVQLSRLDEQICKEEEIFRVKDLDAYLRINTNFHLIIAEASDNVALYDHIAAILSRTFVCMVFYEQFFSLPRNPTLEDHKNILQALQQKNATAAIEHMRRHIAVSMEGLGRLKD